MTALAEAYVTIRADDARLPGELNKVQSMFGRAADNIAAKFAMTGYVFRRLVDVGKEFAHAVASEEEEASKFAAIVDASGRGEYFRQMVSRFGEASEAATAFSSDAVRAAATAIASFQTLGDDTLGQVLKASRDVTALFGGDFAMNARTLAMVLERPEMANRRLRSMKISLTAAEQQYIKTLMESGRLAEAQAAVMEVVTRKTANGAERMAGTLVSLWRRVRIQVEETAESIGVKMADSLKAAANAAIDFMKSVRWLVEGDTLVGKLTMVAAKFLALGMAVNVVAAVWVSVRSILFGTMPWWMWLAAGITAVVTSLFDMKDILGAIQNPWVLWIAGLTAAVLVLPKLIRLMKELYVAIVAVGWSIKTAGWGALLGASASAGVVGGVVGGGILAAGGLKSLYEKMVGANTEEMTPDVASRFRKQGGVFGYLLGPEPSGDTSKGTVISKWIADAFGQISGLASKAFPGIGGGAGGASKGVGFVDVVQWSSQFQEAILKKSDPVVGAIEDNTSATRDVETAVNRMRGDMGGGTYP